MGLNIRDVSTALTVEEVFVAKDGAVSAVDPSAPVYRILEAP